MFAVMLSFLYIHWVPYIVTVYGVSVDKMGPLRLVNANSVQKHKFPSETIPQLFFIDVKMLLCTRKIWKACKVRSSFCLLDRPNQFRHFFFQTGSLARSQNSPMVITVFRSESSGSMLADSRLSSPTDHFHILSVGQELAFK